jgi:hypothetical protein
MRAGYREGNKVMFLVVIKAAKIAILNGQNDY